MDYHGLSTSTLNSKLKVHANPSRKSLRSLHGPFIVLAWQCMWCANYSNVASKYDERDPNHSGEGRPLPCRSCTRRTASYSGVMTTCLRTFCKACSSVLDTSAVSSPNHAPWLATIDVDTAECRYKDFLVTCAASSATAAPPLDVERYVDAENAVCLKTGFSELCRSVSIYLKHVHSEHVFILFVTDIFQFSHMFLFSSINFNAYTDQTLNLSVYLSIYLSS